MWGGLAGVVAGCSAAADADEQSWPDCVVLEDIDDDIPPVKGGVAMPLTFSDESNGAVVVVVVEFWSPFGCCCSNGDVGGIFVLSS